MYNLSDFDSQLQTDRDQSRTEDDHFYGWDLDVSGTWYNFCPRTLNDRDSFYADSSWSFF